jgi:hypothetical protein
MSALVVDRANALILHEVDGEPAPVGSTRTYTPSLRGDLPRPPCSLSCAHDHVDSARLGGFRAHMVARPNSRRPAISFLRCRPGLSNCNLQLTLSTWFARDHMSDQDAKPVYARPCSANDPKNVPSDRTRLRPGCCQSSWIDLHPETKPGRRRLHDDVLARQYTRYMPAQTFSTAP